MALFTTRVELLNSNPADYAPLHNAMAQQGFVRTVTSNNGTTYHLPLAEYNFEGNLDRAEILRRAQTAVASVNRNARIFVSEAVARTWSNLDQI